jgi:hypothetical protein
VITIHNTVTGEIQFVASLDGIDLTVWETTGEAVPTDLESRAYVSVGGVPTAEPKQSFSCLDFLALWTAPETRAVMQTTDDFMARAWGMTLASPTINLTDPRTIGGVQLAQSLGILTADRTARILAGLPPT